MAASGPTVEVENLALYARSDTNLQFFSECQVDFFENVLSFPRLKCPVAFAMSSWPSSLEVVSILSANLSASFPDKTVTTLPL